MALGPEIRRFKCRGDDDGIIYEVIEYAIAGPTFSPAASGRQHFSGGSEFRLANGRNRRLVSPVDHRDTRTFRICDTGQIIRMI